MENADNTIIRCRNAAFGYDGHIVVRDLNFALAPGDFLCVAGENGSGKSTLVRGLLRLASPMLGTVEFRDDICRTETGYLSQDAAAKKDFPAGVFEIAVSGNLGRMGLRPFYSAAEKRAARENLRRLGIAGLESRCFRELSGGQQRRALLARALCAARKLLVLDEPFAGLDPLISADLYSLLKTINREQGMTIVMVSHDIEAAACASHVLHLHGRQVFFGAMDEYRRSDTGKNFFKTGDENVQRNF